MDLLDKLKKLKVPAADLDNFDESFNEGPKSIGFTRIVSWLSEELQTLCDLECCVNPITDPDDSNTFVVEVSSFMKETQCPHQCLLEGPMSQRLLHKKNKIKLLSFLISELSAARMIYSKKPTTQKAMIVEMQESGTAKMMKEMLISLGFSKPPPNVTPIKIFMKVEKKLQDLVKHPKLEIGDPLFTGTLTEKQWHALEKLQAEMHEDYKSRRNMLLMRLDVTVQSFSWSERLKNVNVKIYSIYDVRREQLSISPSVCLADLLAARKDLIIIEKTSSSSVRENTKSSINKIVIGSVPDRGGRPEEQQPPPPEVPSWQKNEPSKSSFRGSTGGGRGDKRQSFGGQRDQTNFSNFSSNQSNGTPQYTSYGDQGKNFGYSNVRNDFNSQPHSYPSHFSNNPNNYNYQPQGGAGNAFQGGGDFGVGFGGYGATGGNFQQYGAPPTNYQQDTYRGRGRGQPRRGGGRRGGRGSDYYGYQQH